MGKIFRIVNDNDVKLFYYVNNYIKCAFLDRIIPCISHLGGAAFTVIFSMMLMIYGKGNFKLAGYLCGVTLTVSHIFVHFIKKVFSRERPYRRLLGVNTFKLELRDYSFPSGHTTAAFSIAVSLSIVFPVVMLLLIFGALMVGFSRIYLGVHYPTDVVVGMIIGTMVAIMTNALFSEKIMNVI